MDKLYFNQTGGFPLSTNILNAIQQAYGVFNALGGVAGNLAILSGCEIAGNNIADGVVFIDGEVLPFRGGAISASVIIDKNTENRVFEDGATKMVLAKRYACFGSTTPNYAFADFKRISKTLPQLAAEKAEKTALEELIKEVAELKKKTAVFGVSGGGGMVLWNKPANLIPAGWREVTDWKGKMPVGWDGNDTAFNKIRESHGGSKTAHLYEYNLPAHNHAYKDAYLFESVSDYNTVPGGGVEHIVSGFGYAGSGSVDADNQYMYYKNRTTETAGSGYPIDILPPYRVVMFIEYVG